MKLSPLCVTLVMSVALSAPVPSFPSQPAHGSEALTKLEDPTQWIGWDDPNDSRFVRYWNDKVDTAIIHWDNNYRKRSVPVVDPSIDMKRFVPVTPSNAEVSSNATTGANAYLPKYNSHITNADERKIALKNHSAIIRLPCPAICDKLAERSRTFNPKKCRTLCYRSESDRQQPQKKKMTKRLYNNWFWDALGAWFGYDFDQTMPMLDGQPEWVDRDPIHWGFQ
ncbi:hypothetical protein BU24DRAFT_410252 [Aaosphaeria arxii CBS 175.79]|uniref:Uncharacterized protein n=1 Tax=Aaosphaeria arxii CBS 175.79 TaxID=1450172 RepID=A0A6A5XQA9_9PLEO|nr:uncharacterized protein BU24DRAFT_410252 [Aaosphaeria arxii CBS 175.79]KAF2014514.1 hypothetical protein BU24DRAFT_410252 [Aaosphaeria arxii CBS 175.79]